MVVGVEGKNRDKSQRSMILRKIKDKTVSLELVNSEAISMTLLWCGSSGGKIHVDMCTTVNNVHIYLP